MSEFCLPVALLTCSVHSLRLGAARFRATALRSVRCRGIAPPPKVDIGEAVAQLCPVAW